MSTNGGYGAAPTLCPAVMVILGIVFLPVLWPFFALMLIFGGIALAYVAIRAVHR